jgi:hypothetical protein
MLFLRTIAEYRIAHTYTQLGPQLQNFVIQMLTQPPLLLLALFGVWATHRYGTDRERDLLPMLGLWLLGIVLTVAAHALDQAIAQLLGRLAVGGEIVRDIRFISFFFFMAAFMGFSIYWDAGILQARFSWIHRIPPALAGLILVLFLLQGAVQPILFLVLPSSAAQAAAGAKDRANGELIRALGELTPPGAKIFMESGDYLVRYAALRNLAFSHKDGALLLYGKNVPGLRDWYPVAHELGNPDNLGLIDKTPRPANKSETLLACASRTDSDFLVVSAPARLPLLQKAHDIIWNNSHYVMLRLTRANQGGAP